MPAHPLLFLVALDWVSRQVCGYNETEIQLFKTKEMRIRSKELLATPAVQERSWSGDQPSQMIPR